MSHIGQRAKIAHTKEHKNTKNTKPIPRSTQVRGPREEVKPLLLLNCVSLQMYTTRVTRCSFLSCVNLLYMEMNSRGSEDMNSRDEHSLFSSSLDLAKRPMPDYHRQVLPCTPEKNRSQRHRHMCQFLPTQAYVDLRSPPPRDIAQSTQRMLLSPASRRCPQYAHKDIFEKLVPIGVLCLCLDHLGPPRDIASTCLLPPLPHKRECF